MGTKLQRAIHLLTTKHFVIESEIRDSMERALDHRSIEAVKITMLKQEETFKQQVIELHRLYSVQRMLMDEVKKEMNEQRKYNRSRAPSCSQGTVGLGHSFRMQSGRDDAHMLELSRSCSSNTKTGAQPKLDFGFDFSIIRPADQSNSAGMSIRSMDAVAGSSEDLCGVDLTLSIGGGSSSKKKRLSSEATKSDRKSREEEEPSLSMRASSAGEQGDEKRPPWSLL